MEDARFEELLAECRGALARLVHFKISAYADAEDVIQDACVAAYRAKDGLRDENLFRGWLLQIGRNRVRDYYRARGRRREDSADVLPERAVGNMRGRADVDAALMKLSERDREVLRLYYTHCIFLLYLSYSAKSPFSNTVTSLPSGVVPTMRMSEVPIIKSMWITESLKVQGSSSGRGRPRPRPSARWQEAFSSIRVQ